MPSVSKQVANQINFLASSTFQSFTEYVDSTNAGVIDENGRKLIPAGTIWPANDASAKGVTINTVDVTENAQPVGVIVDGYLLAQRLPVVPVDAAKAAMTGIKWPDSEK